MRRNRRNAGTIAVMAVLMGVVGLSAIAQESSCSAAASIDPIGMKTLTERQVISWADAPTAMGVPLGEALRDYSVDISMLTTGTEVPLVLPGNVETSIFVLEREVKGQPLNHDWVILYSVAPPAVRQALERQSIRYPWSGFVMRMDDNDPAPIRIGMLGQSGFQLIYNPRKHTFERNLLPTPGGLQIADSQDCMSCILDLVKSVVCEAVADGVSCATLAGCPGAVLSALIRATFKLITGDLCFWEI